MSTEEAEGLARAAEHAKTQLQETRVRYESLRTLLADLALDLENEAAHLLRVATEDAVPESTQVSRIVQASEQMRISGALSYMLDHHYDDDARS